jgi:hypothetical protein
MNVMAFDVQLFSSLFVITIRNYGFFFLLEGRSVIKSIDNSLWNLSGTGRGFKNLFRLFFSINVICRKRRNSYRTCW